ncbi:ATP-binding protein [Thalassospira alkalitolerans]|uniref:ATP-binding protein n=1 Tax=Thalassospira alkalitolerans TaxID=1293890 RepID=UPI003AA97EEB
MVIAHLVEGGLLGMGHDKHYVLKFGEFELEMPHKNLSRDGTRLKLGGRAVSLLAVLAEADGALVSRDMLLAQVWPGQTIDDSAIRVHLSALRKALGPVDDGNHVIVNEAGRGYRLALIVSRSERPNSSHFPEDDHVNINLPARIGAIIGQDLTIASLSDELIARRLITVAGPGGIGKTTIGIAAGRSAAQKTGAAAFFVDFSPIGNDGLVAPTIAVSLGLTSSTSDLFGALIKEFRGKTTLLVFDNCEHVLEEVSRIAENLLVSLPDLMILCTSREPLGAQGEWIHRLAPLELPPVYEETISDDIGRFPSVQLFCERAKSVRNDFVLGPKNWTAVVDICRRLDGMPLAIEFAAARMNVLTAAVIAEGLKERFDLLSKGRRTAIPRHKTLRATLDWSYDLLGESARLVLNRLSVFRNAFDVEDAGAVAVGGKISDVDVFDELVDLVEKSMLIPQSRNGEMYYRLLETTRQYAMEKLVTSGEANAVRKKHATYVTSLFSDTKDVWEGKASRASIDVKSHYIDDILSAIDWAIGEDGDIELGQGVLAASSSLWFHLSLPGEFLAHTRRFLSAIEYDGGDDRSFELLAAYGHALWHKEGPGDEMRDAFEKALAIAQRRRDEPLVLRAIWGIWAQQILSGNYDQSLLTANDFFGRLRPDDGVANRATGLHMKALSTHFCGDHETALILLVQVIEADKAPIRVDHANHAQVDGKVAVMSLLMRIKWLTGAFEEAMKIAVDCAEDAFGLDHTLSICYGLGVGCIPVAIANKEYDLARKWIIALRAQTNSKGLDHWGNFADGYEAAIEGRCDFPVTSSKMQSEMFKIACSSCQVNPDQVSDVKWFCSSVMAP